MKEKLTKAEIALLRRLLAGEIDKLFIMQRGDETAERLDDLFSLDKKLYKLGS